VHHCQHMSGALLDVCSLLQTDHDTQLTSPGDIYPTLPSVSTTPQTVPQTPSSTKFVSLSVRREKWQIDSRNSVTSTSSISIHIHCRCESSVCDRVCWKVVAHIAGINNAHGDKALIHLLPPQQCGIGLPVLMVIFMKAKPPHINRCACLSYFTLLGKPRLCVPAEYVSKPFYARLQQAPINSITPAEYRNAAGTFLRAAGHGSLPSYLSFHAKATTCTPSRQGGRSMKALDPLSTVTLYGHSD
jgi:hypothetical protein